VKLLSGDQFSISNLMTAMSQPSLEHYPQPVAIQTLSTVRALRWVESSSVNARRKVVRNCTPAADTLGAFRESDGIHIKEIRSNAYTDLLIQVQTTCLPRVDDKRTAIQASRLPNTQYSIDGR
jgi:hypothetical protein